MRIDTMRLVTWCGLFGLSLAGVGCLSDIDFASVEATCEAPRFDAPHLDTFCSGERPELSRLELPDGVEGEVIFLSSERGRTLIVAAEETTHPELPEWTLHTNHHFIEVADEDLSRLDELEDGEYRSSTLGVSEAQLPSIVNGSQLFEDLGLYVLDLFLEVAFVDLERGLLTPIMIGRRLPRRVPCEDEQRAVPELRAVCEHIDALPESPFSVVWSSLVLPSPKDPAGRRLVVSAANSGLKVVTVERGPEGRVEEHLPHIPTQLRETVTTRFACNIECRNVGSDLCANCAARTAILNIPSNSQALSLAIDDPDAPTVLYIGGFNGILTMPVEALEPWDSLGDVTPEEFLAEVEDGVYARWAPPNQTLSGEEAVTIIIAMHRRGDILYVLSTVVAADDLEETGPARDVPTRPTLLAVELDEDNRPKRLLSQLELPWDEGLSLQAQMKFIGDDILIVRQSAQEYVRDVSSGLFNGTDATTWVLDVGAPEEPILLHQQTHPSDGVLDQNGLGAVELDGASSALFPVPGGVQPFQLRVEGDRLAP